MKEAIRDHKLVWKRGKKGADYSLEALELEFGIERPVAIRSRGHDYADGDTGEMAPLVYEQLEYRRKATQRQKADLELYCRYDVQSLYKISRECTRA
jgi:hypothetical protein